MTDQRIAILKEAIRCMEEGANIRNEEDVAIISERRAARWAKMSRRFDLVAAYMDAVLYLTSMATAMAKGK